MTDFKTQIQTFTCVSEEAKQKILSACANLDEAGQEKVLAILKEGEVKKDELEKKHDQEIMDSIQKFMTKTEEFNRVSLRKARKQVEKFDRSNDADQAEQLLNEI